jgi:hypothetical protein
MKIDISCQVFFEFLDFIDEWNALFFVVFDSCSASEWILLHFAVDVVLSCFVYRYSFLLPL